MKNLKKLKNWKIFNRRKKTFAFDDIDNEYSIDDILTHIDNFLQDENLKKPYLELKKFLCDSKYELRKDIMFDYYQLEIIEGETLMNIFNEFDDVIINNRKFVKFSVNGKLYLFSCSWMDKLPGFPENIS